MSEEISDGLKYGLDLGTMNIVSACLGDGNITTKSLRNIFLKVEKEATISMELSKITHVEIDDDIFILSEDAYNFANIFGKTANRPMSKGLISSGEIDSIDILGIMVKQLIGTSKGGKCCYSVPANPIDDPSKNIIYHQNIFGRIIQSLGFTSEAVNEAAAIVYSECESTNFSGIGISFGAGMTNVAVVYKSIPAITFSVARGGDWIDENTANSIGMVPTRITLVKENNFDMTNFDSDKKKEKKIKEALFYYYTDLINYTIKHIVNALKTTSVELPDSLPIVISGGTSKPNGFLDIVSNSFSNYELPFDISDIKHANNPLTAVAEGCLVCALK